jgi:hypothetical protein
MFPKSDDYPPVATQSPIYGSVSSSIALDLIQPEPSIRHGKFVAPFAPMPETAVDENSNPLSIKHEIGGPVNVTRIHSPARQTDVYQSRAQPPFGRFVAAAAIGGHDLRAFLLRENIRHLLLRHTMEGPLVIWKCEQNSDNPDDNPRSAPTVVLCDSRSYRLGSRALGTVPLPHLGRLEPANTAPNVVAP